MAVWGGLTNSWEKERSRKEKKERRTHLNAEFQRIARTDKKTLSEQCKEIEESNRMGKTRDLFKKIRHTKGTFHTKMGTIKDMKGINLIEAEDIKKRWQEYTEELYKKGLNHPDNHFVFLHFFFLAMVLITTSCTVLETSIHSSSGTLSIRSSSLNLFVTSTV